MLALTATMPASIQNTTTIFIVLTMCVAAFYSMVLVHGVKKLRPPPSPRMANFHPKPLNTAPAQRVLAKPLEEDAVMLEYKKRLEKLDEAVKLIEEKLKTPAQQDAAEQKVVENTGLEEGLEDLKEVLELAKSLRDEVSRLSLGGATARETVK
ncbi:MAG: hypothetical protein QXX19_00995 [Candidatus Caldarchaeum sp.]